MGRKHGAQIAAEHARMHARLTTASQRVGMVPTPAAPDLSRFAALSGPEFDREFITDQVKNQREALGLYESEAQAGQNPRLRSMRSWIRKMPPVVALLALFSIEALGANDITGSVCNQSRGEPAAGDEVVLARLDRGMQEEARARTDSSRRAPNCSRNPNASARCHDRNSTRCSR